MILHIHLHVKFRAFGVTFGVTDFTHALTEIPLPAMPPIAKKALFNARGVLLEIWTE